MSHASEPAGPPSSDMTSTSASGTGDQRFRLLVDAVLDYAIFMLDPGGHVVTWNTGAQRIYGYAAHEIVGRHFSRFYPADAVQRGWPLYELQEAQKHGRFE